MEDNDATIVIVKTRRNLALRKASRARGPYVASCTLESATILQRRVPSASLVSPLVGDISRVVEVLAHTAKERPATSELDSLVRECSAVSDIASGGEDLQLNIGPISDQCRMFKPYVDSNSDCPKAVRVSLCWCSEALARARR